jgi:hypothetical protein
MGNDLRLREINKYSQRVENFSNVFDDIYKNSKWGFGNI